MLGRKKIAALLNFFVWGSGYVYNGNKLLLGFGFIITTIIIHVPLLYTSLRYYAQFPGIMIFLGHVLISVLLAYDAYKDSGEFRF